MGAKNQDLKLGIIGFSDGNGHPYSWAAICNGYDTDEMSRSGFPVISDYLAKRVFPDDLLPSVKVTHVWTQSTELSRQISKASLIPNICLDPLEMIGHVDGILLARDDAENHYRLASPFLQVGLPVYVDKPFALSANNASNLWKEAQHDWQIFTCSALYFAKEILPTAEITSLGKIRSIHAITPKSWETYGAHIVDPVLRILSSETVPQVLSHSKQNGATHLLAKFPDDVFVHFEATGISNTSIRFHFTGENGSLSTVFADSFSAFKSALSAFITQIRERQLRISRAHTVSVVKILEAGCS